MKKQAMFVVASMAFAVSGCGTEQPAEMEAAQLVDQVYADESFQATVRWLEADKAIPVDLSQGVVEHRDDVTRITFALPSQAVTSLAFEVREDGTTLYAYHDYARDTFEYGRKVSYRQTWHDCRWMAQSTTCYSTCS